MKSFDNLTSHLNSLNKGTVPEEAKLYDGFEPGELALGFDDRNKNLITVASLKLEAGDVKLTKVFQLTLKQESEKRVPVTASLAITQQHLAFGVAIKN